MRATAQKGKGKAAPRRQTREIKPNRRQPVSQALVVRAPDPKPWLLSQDEVSILKNAICKGASDDELKFCLSVARRRQLDPFAGQIWFVKRWDSTAVQTDGKRGGNVWTPQVSIDGLLHIAARDHKDFGTYGEPTFGPMMEVSYQKSGSGPTLKLKVPEWARVEGWKKGDPHPTAVTVWWEEIYPDIDYAPLVRRMPRLMLAKCAKAQVTRTNYPSTGGLLIPEETQSKEFTQFTPEGRIYTPKETPALENFKKHEAENLKHLTPAQREVVERKMKEAEEKKKAPAIDIPPPGLAYIWFEESRTAEITGSESVLHANRELFAHLWNGSEHKIIANGEQLEAIKFELQKREIAFKRLREAGE